MSTNVIKARMRTESFPSVVIKKATRQASLEAKEMIARARNEAAEIVANAECEKDKIFEESKQRGLSEGLDKWNDILADAWQARKQYLAKNETELVKLATAIARKILGDGSNIDPGALIHTARQAIRAGGGHERKVRLRVRPADEAAARSRATELAAFGPETCEIVFIVDETIVLGGCIVESDMGVIDATFSTQLASLERALLQGVETGGN